MTYFGFLLRFLVIPILILLAVALWDRRQGRQRDALLRGVSIWAAIALHVVIALIYTTPWDNYLVATGVWWYDPAKVTGLTLGWVPIEEYTFFVLQPILGGLWLAFLARRLPAKPEPLRASLRLWLPAALGVVWLGSVALLISGWDPGTYLGLQLVWALPPIMLQLAFGADILWRHRRLVAWAIIPLTLYLSATDTLAIAGGTWTIDPAQSLNIYLGGILPLEELLFFLFTNILVTFGIVLLWAEASHARVTAMIAWWRGREWRTPGQSPNQPAAPLPERME
ncbi:lycopene cyclase domain-containing protein [Promineifilum sp.]|uniref:lycopene cyclase domain-containing protein n=1 Tax=Promineifilum sp. TaxID=2664178 RepID=UPI0035B03714